MMSCSGFSKLSFRHAREFYSWFGELTRRPEGGGCEARALLGLCDRYYLLTEIIGRADMLWHGDIGESPPAGNVWLYERCREVELPPMTAWTCGRDHAALVPSSGRSRIGPQPR